MLFVTWVVISNPQSELIFTNVVVPEHSSLDASHLGLNLETETVSDWRSGQTYSLLVDDPSLVEAVVARPPSELLVVLIFAAIDIKALATSVSDVSFLSIDVRKALIVFT